MKSIIKQIATIIILLISFTIIYYYLPWDIFSGEIELPVFISITTFMFAVLSGFFISRQSERYNNINKQIAIWDGHSSAIYRIFGHLGKEAQEEVGAVIKKVYKEILQKDNWDHPFVHKSSFLISIHKILEKYSQDKEISTLKQEVIQIILMSLQEIQKVRKNIIALRMEKVPRSQWAVIFTLVAILFITVSLISSQYLLFAAITKAVFITVLAMIILLLRRFNNLNFYERNIGEHSARDVIEIIEGKK